MFTHVLCVGSIFTKNIGIKVAVEKNVYAPVSHDDTLCVTSVRSKMQRGWVFFCRCGPTIWRRRNAVTCNTTLTLVTSIKEKTCTSAAGLCQTRPTVPQVCMLWCPKFAFRKKTYDGGVFFYCRLFCGLYQTMIFSKFGISSRQ